MRRVIGAALAASLAFSSLAAIGLPASQRALEEGKRQFGSRQLAEALLSFQRAQELRAKEMDTLSDALKKALDDEKVQRASHGGIELERKVMLERGLMRGLAVMDEYDAAYGSPGALYASDYLKAFDTMRVFPEADRWIGKVYEAEGELAIALRYYDKALASSSSLLVPGERQVIAYEAARVQERRGQLADMVKRYEAIIDSDLASKRDLPDSIVDAMIRNLKEYGLGKVAELYRPSSGFSLEARLALLYFYERSKRYALALRYGVGAFAMLISDLAGSVAERDSRYRYSGISDLLGRLDAEERAFLEKIDYWRYLYHFALALMGEGELKEAMEVFGYMRHPIVPKKWADRAAEQLRMPHME